MSDRYPHQLSTPAIHTSDAATIAAKNRVTVELATAWLAAGLTFRPDGTPIPTQPREAQEHPDLNAPRAVNESPDLPEPQDIGSLATFLLASARAPDDPDDSSTALAVAIARAERAEAKAEEVLREALWHGANDLVWEPGMTAVEAIQSLGQRYDNAVRERDDAVTRAEAADSMAAALADLRKDCQIRGRWREVRLADTALAAYEAAREKTDVK